MLHKLNDEHDVFLPFWSFFGKLSRSIDLFIAASVTMTKMVQSQGCHIKYTSLYYCTLHCKNSKEPPTRGWRAACSPRAPVWQPLNYKIIACIL